ncbi:hypothetical protein BCF55_0534 [Hydrogenivirga caldilitoris]|uniref:Uncharacterized protein n=1 Tax=Hydrogenivirga caldilitoris TaxID=246264 RepID=A0A497XN32_9AQUI|nr:DUF5752 family protein [Hydrogenivirga caldilitoris]RLJ70268.1 hypothetical protein BCF55_0534 [Hydrogenivirga caldilitoris]
MAPFIFKSELWTAQYTGVKVNTLAAFMRVLQEIDEDSIYYHLYRNLFEYHLLPTDYGNSFAYWLAENGFPVLAEKFSAIDLMECVCIEDIREEMLNILHSEPNGFERLCKPFYFIRAVRKVVDTGVTANNLEEFKKGLSRVGVHSLFYHLVTSRLVNREPVNDFSKWLRSIGEESLAVKIDKIDLMAHSLYEVREMIITNLES